MRHAVPEPATVGPAVSPEPGEPFHRAGVRRIAAAAASYERPHPA
jgi:hypothetical protein